MVMDSNSQNVQATLISRRKRRAQRNLDEEETPRKDSRKKKKEKKLCVSSEGSKVGENESSNALPSCIDQLREELSCAICLEICFEPSTTPCGHSFCRKCLQTAADKCDKKCPKCRQLTSNGRSCTVNTVLWNTIQLLFPQEVEARKVALKTVEDRAAADRAGSARQQAAVNVQSSGGSASDTLVEYLRLYREEVVEMTRRLEVIERNQEEIRDLALELIRNQRPSSS